MQPYLSDRPLVMTRYPRRDRRQVLLPEERARLRPRLAADGQADEPADRQGCRVLRLPEPGEPGLRSQPGRDRPPRLVQPAAPARPARLVHPRPRPEGRALRGRDRDRPRHPAPVPEDQAAQFRQDQRLERPARAPAAGRCLHVRAVPQPGTTDRRDHLPATARDRHRHPRNPERRGGKVYIDFVQNGRGRLLVAPFSVRPLPAAPVSTPLRWSEVKPGLDLRDHNIRTVPERLKKLKSDPLRGVLTETPDLLAALRHLSELV